MAIIMTFTISRRGMVRLVSFALALILVLSLLAAGASRSAQRSRLALEYRAMQSMSDLAAHMQNIDSTLEKALYAKTPSMLSSLSSKLWREAGFAKMSLDSLPIECLELQNTNKLLSQVGDYCVSLSRAFERGGSITPEQRQNMLSLQKYCDAMLDQILVVNDGLQTGSVSLSELEGNLSRDFDRSPASPTVAEGFTEFEEGFTSYPSLIYDGPFSDHILERDPAFLEGRAAVSRASARKTAAYAAGLRETQLADGNDEEGKMPSYAFSGEGIDVSVTKAGGYLCYLMNSRLVRECRLTPKEALTRAKEFLNALGIRDMAVTYYETGGCEMTVNLACTETSQNGKLRVMLYPDLIKVKVALDNGEITGFDARGYLMNHRARQNLAPGLTEQACRASVSELLTIESSQLCIVPSEGQNEVLCWEYKCTSPDGQNVLVYVNAATGMEEQILILVIGENGQLTV